MKKFVLFTLMTLFCMTLFAEKVYRSDGTFLRFRETAMFSLRKSMRFRSKHPKTTR
ncbi:hypothetical protein IKS86_06235 [bacterium]|nr:hypothetical protein [bacterium]